MHSRRAALLTLLACGVGCDASTALPASATTADGAVLDAGRSIMELCAGSASWTISATGTGLGAFEGQRAWLSAIEGTLGSPAGFKLVVLVAGRVTGGALELECRRSLHTNSAYPAASVTIDADGSGDCSKGDVQQLSQYYAWSADISYPLTAGALSPIPDASATVSGGQYCDAFFNRPR